MQASCTGSEVARSLFDGALSHFVTLSPRGCGDLFLFLDALRTAVWEVDAEKEAWRAKKKAARYGFRWEDNPIRPSQKHSGNYMKRFFSLKAQPQQTVHEC